MSMIKNMEYFGYVYFQSFRIYWFNIIWRFSFSCIICLITRFVELTSWLFLDNRSCLLIINIRNSCFRIYFRLIMFRYIWSRITFFIRFFNRHKGLNLLRNIFFCFLIFLRFNLNWRATFFIILSIWFSGYSWLWITFFRWLNYFSTLCFSLYNRSCILNIFIINYFFFEIILWSKLYWLPIRLWWFFCTKRNYIFIFLFGIIFFCFLNVFWRNFIFKW